MSLALLTLLTLASGAPGEIRVTGIVSSTNPGRSAAIFEADGRRRVASVGEIVFGARISSIGPDQVTLDLDDGDVVLHLSGAVVASSPPVAGPRAVAPDPGLRVAHIERAEVDRRLKVEMSRILSETQLRAVRDDGAVRGLAVVRLPAGTLLTEVGLQSGDVITEINGVELDGMATLIGLWPRLQGATELRATVLRDGRSVPLAVSLE